MKPDTNKFFIDTLKENIKYAYKMMSEYEEIIENTKRGSLSTSLILSVNISEYFYWPEKNQLDSPLKLASDLIIRKAEERYYYWRREFEGHSTVLAEKLCEEAE